MKTEVCLYSLHVMQELTLWLVGSIGDRADSPADIQPDDSLELTLPTPRLIPNEIELETTNGPESLYMDSFMSGEDGGSLQSVGQSILWSLTFADVSYPRDPRQSIFAHRRLHRTSTVPRPSRRASWTAQTVKRGCSMVVI